MDDKAPTLHLTLPEVVAMRHCLCVVIENAVPVLSEFDEGCAVVFAKIWSHFCERILYAFCEHVCAF